MRAWCSCCCSLLLACVTLAVCNACPACSLLQRRASLLALAEQASVQGQEGWQEESVSVQLRRCCLCSAGRQPMGAQLAGHCRLHGVCASRSASHCVAPLLCALQCGPLQQEGLVRSSGIGSLGTVWWDCGGSSATISSGSIMRHLLLQRRVHHYRQHAATVIAEQCTSPNLDLHSSWGSSPGMCGVLAQPVPQLGQHSRDSTAPQPPRLVSFGPTVCMLSPARRAPPAVLPRRYDIKAPSMFNTRNVGKTLVTRTQGTKVRRVQGWGVGGGPGVRYKASRVVGMEATAAGHQAEGRGRWHTHCQLSCSVVLKCVPSPAPLPQIASDGLKGRVVEVSLADLQNVRRPCLPMCVSGCA